MASRRDAFGAGIAAPTAEDILDSGREPRWARREHSRPPRRLGRPRRRTLSSLIALTAAIVAGIGVVAVLTHRGLAALPADALQPAASGDHGTWSVSAAGTVTAEWPVANTLTTPVTVTAATTTPGPLRQIGGAFIQIGAALPGVGTLGGALPFEVGAGEQVNVIMSFTISDCGSAIAAAAQPEVAFRASSPHHRSTLLAAIPVLPDGLTDGNWLSGGLACTQSQAAALLTAGESGMATILTGSGSASAKTVSLAAGAASGVVLRGACVGTGSITMAQAGAAGVVGSGVVRCERYYTPGSPSSSRRRCPPRQPHQLRQLSRRGRR